MKSTSRYTTINRAGQTPKRTLSRWFGGLISLPQRRGTAALASLVLTALVLSALPTAVYASTYGSGAYGSCTYGSCTTQTTLPGSGLQVSINLTNGQILPPTGYTFVVTPLNGSGTTFSNVDFYINGVLAHSQTPATDGTVQWFWQPNSVTAADIKIVISDQSGQSTTEEFHVVVAVPQAAPHSAVAAAPSFIQTLELAPVRFIQVTEQVIQKLPAPVKYGIPYFLFAILAGDALFLLYHIRREIRESQKLQGLISREREIGDLKKTFVLLISHYLRTPLSILKGGIDLFASMNKTAPAALTGLQADAQALSSKIESIIGQHADQVEQPVAGEGEAATQSSVPVWRQPILLIPVILVGMTAFSFDFLAQHAGSFSLQQVNLVIQIVIFGSCAIVLYAIARQFTLHRRTTAEAKHVLNEEIYFNQNRDAFIEDTATELKDTLDSLDTHVAALGVSPASKFLEKGRQEFHNIVNKFVVAQQLKGSSTSSPITTVQLNTVCTPALQALQDKTAKKEVTIGIADDVAFQIQNPALLTLVIQTILDNAIDYSPSRGHIAVTAHVSEESLTISITDQGPGIPEDKQFALFQAFARVEGAEVFNREGMGFSLYLDRLIMFYLHGEIHVESALPHGTRVVLALRLPM